MTDSSKRLVKNMSWIWPIVGVNPLVTNGFSLPYHLSTFIFRGIRSDFLFHFPMKFKIANRIAPDGTPRFAESHLGVILFAHVP